MNATIRKFHIENFWSKNMFSQENIERGWELIQGSKNVTLLTHSKPDGDGISACAVLEIVLKKLGKNVETVYPDSPEFEFKRQPEKVFVSEHSQLPDLLIACDTANSERMYYPEIFKGIPLINIDHHVSNSIKGTVNFVDSESSSACEVLFLLLQAWEQSLIGKKISELLLFGILYDTRVFSNQGATSSTLRIAADLVDKGADLFKLKNELLANKDPKIIKFWSVILDRIEVDEDKKIAWSYFKQDDLKNFDLTLSSTVGFSNFLAEICQIDVTLLFYETSDGKTKVSLRSKEFDVNQFAALFGGGGHKNAAGIISSEPIEEFMAKVVGRL